MVIFSFLNHLKKKRSDKYVALSNLSIYYTWENIKKSYKNNKFKISAPIWNEALELPDGSYFVSGVQDYFEYILEKYGEKNDNLSIRIYVNKRENRITFKIITLLTPETIKLLGSAKSKITKDKNGKNLPRLEITEVVVLYCKIVNNDYQQDSRVLCKFVPNKPFGQLLDISRYLYF